MKKKDGLIYIILILLISIIAGCIIYNKNYEKNIIKEINDFIVESNKNGTTIPNKYTLKNDKNKFYFINEDKDFYIIKDINNINICNNFHSKELFNIEKIDDYLTVECDKSDIKIKK